MSTSASGVPTFRVRRLRAEEWSTYRDLRLRALADSPDAFGSVLQIERQHPDSHWAQRLSSEAASEWSLPLVAEDADRLVGLVWGRIDPSEPETVHVFQMWVAPERRGLGVAKALIDAVVAWAKDARARHLVLRVTCGDSAARRLYDRAGFEPFGEPESLRPGSEVFAQPMRRGL
jgi:ribosomal protein S18 acetylase RimI-like enzyme